jgi:hypothetical protein
MGPDTDRQRLQERPLRRKRRRWSKLGDHRLVIETAKLNGVSPHAWLADTLTKLVNGWTASKIDDLVPWAYAKILDCPVNVGAGHPLRR